MAGRPSTGPPRAVIHDHKTVGLLADTMRRAKPVAIPDSLRRQMKEVVRLALSNRRNGSETISPTINELKQAARCESRQARNNMRTLEEWGALIRLQKGGGTEAATYAFDGEALFRKLVSLGCNPGKDLRKGLRPPETHRYEPAPPPAVTPAVDQTPSPAVRSTFSVLDQQDNLSENAFGPHLQHTPAVKDCFSHSNQCDNDNENSLPLIYGTLVRAEFQSCSVSNCQEIAGELSLSVEPPAPETKPLPCYPEKKHIHLDKPPRAASSDLNAKRPHLSSDAALMLDHLRQIGPSTYGACATALGVGATRAWRAEAELLAAGAVRSIALGRMMVITEEEAVSGVVLPFALGARANAKTPADESLSS